jgi:hypothetical protein
MPTTMQIPKPPAGPRGEQIPDAAQLQFIQWLYGIAGEPDYGPCTREAVASLQRARSIPVDDEVMIGPRTWTCLLEVYKVKTTPPAPPAGPTGEEVPAGARLTFIQWTYQIDGETDYGPRTREAVADLQRSKGIPVDDQVMIGPRTWTALLAVYQARVAALTSTWEVPEKPLQLDGDTAPEVWLRHRLAQLNDDAVPDAARRYVRNLKIAKLNAAGTLPTAQVLLPDLDDPLVQETVAQLTWDQEKVDKLWAKATEIGIDPRVMLAVLIQEGTGSFDTNADVPTQFWNGGACRYYQGGSGVQPDFDRDVAAAMDQHILAKVRAYGQYALAFQQAVREAGLGDGNVFQYVNYNVPWIKSGGWRVRPGCYATHTEWWVGLRNFFDAMAGEGATHAYSQHLAVQPLAVNAPAPAVRFQKTNNGTGATELITNQPWVEAFPV